MLLLEISSKFELHCQYKGHDLFSIWFNVNLIPLICKNWGMGEFLLLTGRICYLCRKLLVFADDP